jgi:hypothetical protein
MDAASRIFYFKKNSILLFRAKAPNNMSIASTEVQVLGFNENKACNDL